MGFRHLNQIRHDLAAKYHGIWPGNVKALDDALAEAQINGIRLAASVASDYDRLSLHPYLVSECILGKLNVIKGKPKKNAAMLDWVKGLEGRVAQVEAMMRFMKLADVSESALKKGLLTGKAKARMQRTIKKELGRS
jgi:hypothetical protein